MIKDLISMALTMAGIGIVVGGTTYLIPFAIILIIYSIKERKKDDSKH